MKIQGILNSDISAILSFMRHTDTITVGDCGLPVPHGVECVDLAVRFGLPGLVDVLSEIKKDMKIEKVILASEIKTQNPDMNRQISELFIGCEMVYIPHMQFKKQTADSKAVIRTGEATAYANVILQSACIFGE
jgi:D-ribose pyranase